MTRLAAPLFAFALLAASCTDDTVMSDAGGGGVKDMTVKMVDSGPAPVDSTMGTTATTLHAALTVGAETPTPCAMAMAGATGSATITIDAANTMVTVSNLAWMGLSGTATMAHIHSVATSSVIFPFMMPPANPTTKTFTAADYPAAPKAGDPANFAGFLTVLKAGGAYINIHTAKCPNGEIQGTIK